MAATKTKATMKAVRTSVRRTTASSQTTSGTTRTTSSLQCTTSTPMTTFTPTIAWCTSCVELAHSAHCFTPDDDTAHLMADVRIWVNTVFILISLKTGIARSVNGPKLQGAPCRRRNGEAVPRAVNFGDLITADHKVLSDNCESRNNHRYAVVVQDLATQWIQAYPCKTKTSQETGRSLQKFLEPEENPKVIYTDIFWNSAKLVKISLGIIARLHHIDQSLMGLLKEQCAE